ncbi:MAG: UvrD-helicase domain-containing protein, partial [Muribaculaceae bacterium]|nr:UvrD-helicase domain-containing protein [Muribaculaceae bacterium]
MLEIRKASAGSGKTFQLARKYVLNVLSTTDKSGNLTLNPDPTEAHRRILAITFTNKATAEMKARIISEIARLAYVNDGSFVKSDHRNYLCNELNCSPAELQQAASKALSSILFSYHYFNVSTIDSFFQLVLRNFAREVDLNGDYNVEVGDDQAINIAVQLMLDQAKRDSIENKQSTLLRLINSFMSNRFAEGKKFNIFNRNSSDVSEIVSSVKKLLNEDFKLNTDLQEYLKDDKKLPEFAEKIRKEYKKPLDDIAKEAQYVINKYPFVQGVVNKNAFNAFQKLANKDLGPFSNATFPKIAKGEANYYNNKINIDDKTKEDIKSKALEIRQSYNDYCTLDAICGNLADLEFLKEVLSFIKQYREDNNLILISDTNDILSRIIGNSDAPFIYERIGTEISNYLLDEFQDTSRMQWNNLKPLVDNADSEGGHNLIIGDEKQSIYRFRNADYSLLYEGVKNEIPSATVIDGSNPDDNTNWRSARDVVEFNNKFFEQYAERESLQPNIYEYVRQGIAPKNNDLRGLVLFNNLPQKNFKKAALDVLVSDIKKALHNGFGWGDITVLVNANKEGQEIIDYLLKYKNDNPQDKDFDNFKVVSEESLLISRADSVRFIVSALRLLDPTAIENAKGKDKFSTAELACRYYYAVMKERSLDALDMSRILAETLDKNSDYSLQTEEFVGVFEKDNSTSLVTIVEQIIRQYVPEALLKEENIYLQAFSDVVVEMSARGMNSVHTFLAWWDDKGIDKGIELPSGSGMMQVMTIHKSKGLEFPCVIIPFADWELEKNKGVSWFKKEPIEDFLVNVLSISKDIIPPMLPIENKSALTNTGFKAQYEKNGVAARLDSMNKAYVAFTRAISRLIVTFKESNKRFFGITINDIISSPEVQMETISSEDNPELLEGASVCFYGDKDSKKVEKPNDDDHFGIYSIPEDEMSKYVVDAYSVSPLNEEFKMLSSDEGLPYNSLEIQEGTILHDVMRS